MKIDDGVTWQLYPLCTQGIQLYIEGPYNLNTGLMSTDLNDAGLLPLTQPFGTNSNAE
ncbi:MAG: hypothetical protein K9G76_09810 [Bacteroidales bacterium]|nr:hypothetical protein [Bacteroidales bacterium]MCF8403994.1 hypothetical protein [Bacteroidales bacterium]